MFLVSRMLYSCFSTRSAIAVVTHLSFFPDFDLQLCFCIRKESMKMATRIPILYKFNPKLDMIPNSTN